MSILENLRLTDRSNSYTGVLSGGEQKRLSIALELVDDPAILFLDEPTTGLQKSTCISLGQVYLSCFILKPGLGLDSSSSRQCIQLLQRLATEGKTIVCTIHSTSPLLFDMFNHIYALADGSCIYQGSSNNLVPFLNELDLICPSTYNPADFLLEIADNDYGQLNNRLTEKIQNGSNNEFRSVQDTQQTMHKFTLELYCPNDTSHRFTHQLKQLLIRNILITTRDKTLTLMRLMIHLVLAIFIGIMYKGIGDDASNIFNIYKLLFFNIFLLMFTAFLSLQTTCEFRYQHFNLRATDNCSFLSVPLDLPIVRREHFNEWYSTTAYYFALNIADIPIVIATNFVYIVITYFMTNQPAEPYRFGAYYVTIILLSFSAQGLGLIAGSMLNVKFTLILGAYFICPFVLFSNFFVQVKDVDPIWNWCFQGSFIKHAFEGSMLSIFGFDREKMSCDADYCMYRWPQKFLDSVGITDSFPNVTIKLIAFVFVFRVVAFIIMWCRLRHQK